jgi:hypothetical protein
MKKTFILLFIIILKIIPFNVYSECHIKDREVNFRLALLEGPKERVLKQFAIYNGCPEDRATTIAEYLMNPISEEAKNWSRLYLNENWNYDFELIASAYIEGVNRKPPVTRIEKILYENNIPYVGQARGLSMFRANLHTYCKKPVYPVVSIDPRYRELTSKGLKCELTKEETEKFRDIIREDVKTHPEYLKIPCILYTPIKAYFNQTGDLELLSDLWGYEDQESFCITLATMAKDPEMVKLILDLTYDLDKRGDKKGNILRMSIISLFHEQKDVPEVGGRVRELVGNPGLYYDHIQTLIRILSDPGWNLNQYYLNKTTLETYQKNHDILTKIVKDAKNMIDLRIKIKNEQEASR